MKRSAPSDIEIVQDLLQKALDVSDGSAQQSRSYLNKAYQLAQHHCDNVHRDRTQWRHIRTQILLRRSELEEHEVETDTALALITDAHTSLTSDSPSDVALHVKVVYGRLLMTRGIMDKALEVFHEARAAAIQADNYSTLAVIDGNIATILFNTRHFEEAESWFNKAAATFSENAEHAKQAHAIRGAGMTLSKRGLYNEALAKYREALTVLEQAGESDVKERISIEESIGVDHLNLADATHKQLHYKEALRHFQTAHDLAERHVNSVHRAVAMRNIAQVLVEEQYKQQDLTKARTLFETALEIAVTGSVRLLQAQILRQLSSLYERLGLVTEALNAYRQFYECEREVINEQADAKVRSLEIRAAVEQSESEARHQQQRASDLEEELEQQRKRVTATSLAIGHKNAALREARTKLRELATSSSASLASSSTSLVSDLRYVITQLELAEQNEEYWDGLEEQLSSVHRNALQNLALLHPTLTPTERRVCALIRHDLSTKDIARLLSTEPRTVEKYRQRIRKKLGLTEAENLSNYLSTL